MPAMTVTCPVHGTQLGRGRPPCPKCGRAATLPSGDQVLAFTVQHRDGATQTLHLTQAQAYDVATGLLGGDGLGLNFHVWGGHLGGDDLGTLRQRQLEKALGEYLDAIPEDDPRYDGVVFALRTIRKAGR